MSKFFCGVEEELNSLQGSWGLSQECSHIENMSHEERQKTILITGTASGIGLSLKKHFVELGHSIIAVDITRDIRLIESHPAVLHLTCDCSKEADVMGLFQLLHHKGITCLDVLINNAAISNPYASVLQFQDTTIEEFQSTINVNLTGPFLMSKHAVPLLRLAPTKGRIINISSTRALQSETRTSAAYAASKAGLIGLSHNLAMSLGPDVLVNTIVPGWINAGDYKPTKEDDEQHPAGRVGTPLDVALAVEYLISDRNTFLTGQEIIIDGGMVKKMIYAE